MTEYEVLKRHDVYVVRKVGAQEYAVRCFEWVGRIPVGWWITGGADEAHEFKSKWRAIHCAKSLEHQERKVAKQNAIYDARKSATEERVWR